MTKRCSGKTDNDKRCEIRRKTVKDFRPLSTFKDATFRHSLAKEGGRTQFKFFFWE